MTQAAEKQERDRERTPAVDWAVRAEDVTIWEDDFHLLHIRVGDDAVHENVSPRRVFPLSAKSSYISFLSSFDDEVVLLADPENLDEDSGRALADALERLYFAAKIIRIDDITEAMGVSLWHVATDCGYAKFEVVDRRRYIRIMSGGRFMITDADGNRFDIPCIYDLDEKSQRLIESET